MGKLQDDIEELKKLMIENKEGVKEKKFKYPFGKKVGRHQKKSNYVTVLLLNENGTIDWKKYKVENQTVLHEMIPRLATADHVIFDKKGNPVIILPSWSVEPFSPRKHFEESLDNGSNTKGYSILMNRMKLEQVNAGKKMGNIWKWVIGIGLVGLILFAVLTGGA